MQKTIFIIDSVNNILSHKQFQDLGSSLTNNEFRVIHFSDSTRSNYGVHKLYTYKTKITTFS